LYYIVAFFAICLRHINFSQPHGTILVETKQGGAGHNIITQAESFKADMIVTGTRGRGLVSRAVLGSVSSFVIHHSNKPVVVCR